MKAFMLIVILLAITLPAEATPYTITGGWIYSDWGMIHTGFLFTIPGVVYEGVPGGQVPGMNPMTLLANPGTLVYTMAFIVYTHGCCLIEGVSYDPATGTPTLESGYDLRMTLTLQEPVVLNGPIPVTPNAFTPFTATGTLNLVNTAMREPLTLNLSGEGLLECCFTSGQQRMSRWLFQPPPEAISLADPAGGAPTAVPESASLFMLAVGLGLLALRVQ